MLIGNVGSDPEIRYLEGTDAQSSTKVASFRLATGERYRDRNNELREITEWHSITAWRGNADLVEKYVRKGTQLYVAIHHYVVHVARVEVLVYLYGCPVFCGAAIVFQNVDFLFV